MHAPSHRPYYLPLKLIKSNQKGMVSVDYRQTGRELVLRPSMIKFQAPDWSEIEIARAFDRPSPFYLNRPLIMVLEALGVPYETFKEYQDGAVMDAETARQDFERAGRLLESFGLGASFRLSSIMYHLHKLGVPMQTEDPFYKHLMDFAINHVLRELKHHARIPITGHTLVGVADVHGWLQPNEVFASYVNQQTKKLEYLEGDMVITRYYIPSYLFFSQSESTQVSCNPSRRCANRQSDWKTTSGIPFREGTIAECCRLLHKGYSPTPPLCCMYTQKVSYR